MNPARFLSRALLFLWRVLCFPFRVAFTREDNLGDSTPQFSPIPHPTRQGEGSDGLVLEEYSSESTVANQIECALITRNSVPRTSGAITDIWGRHSRNRCYHPIKAHPCWILRCDKNRKRDQANFEQARVGRQGRARMERPDCIVSHQPVHVACYFQMRSKALRSDIRAISDSICIVRVGTNTRGRRGSLSVRNICRRVA